MVSTCSGDGDRGWVGVPWVGPSWVAVSHPCPLCCLLPDLSLKEDALLAWVVLTSCIFLLILTGAVCLVLCWRWRQQSLSTEG